MSYTAEQGVMFGDALLEVLSARQSLLPTGILGRMHRQLQSKGFETGQDYTASAIWGYINDRIKDGMLKQNKENSLLYEM